jgi:hypothetical protein
MPTSNDEVVRQIIKGHTVDDKLQSIAQHIADLYRGRHEGGVTNKRQKFPRVISCYGITKDTSRNKIYSTFSGASMTANNILINVDTGDKDSIEIEVEIIKYSSTLSIETPLKDIYKKVVGKGIGGMQLSNISINLYDIINIYATYIPTDPNIINNAEVTLAIVGEV